MRAPRSRKELRDDAEQCSAGGWRGWRRLGLLPVVGLAALLPLLGLYDSVQAYEAPLALAWLNTLFLCLLPLSLAYYAARSYAATDEAAFLLAGGGWVVFGVGSLLAGWVMPLAGGPNPTVTVHNLASLLAGAAQITAAFLFLQELLGPGAGGRRWPGALGLYAGLAALMVLTALLAFRGQLPVFFDPARGPSVLRQFVLMSAVVLFAAAAFGFLTIYAVGRTEFAYWYGLALALIALGLIYVFLQHSVGDLLGWSGRIAQYLGAVYLMLAFGRGRAEFAPAASGQSTGLLWPYLEQKVSQRTAALQAEVAAHQEAEAALRDSAAIYRGLFALTPMPQALVDPVSEAVVDANPAAADLLGYSIRAPADADGGGGRLGRGHGAPLAGAGRGGRDVPRGGAFAAGLRRGPAGGAAGRAGRDPRPAAGAPHPHRPRPA